MTQEPFGPSYVPIVVKVADIPATASLMTTVGGAELAGPPTLQVKDVVLLA